jgi:hypothetical protein
MFSQAQKHTKTPKEQKDKGITFWTSDTSPEKYAADKKTDVYNKNKFYLIVYIWKHDGYEDWNYNECCADKHPLQWLVEVRENLYKREVYEQIHLISWNEIPFSFYKKYKDCIG